MTILQSKKQTPFSEEAKVILREEQRKMEDFFAKMDKKMSNTEKLNCDMLTLLKELVDLRGMLRYDSIIWDDAMALIKKIEG